MSAVIAQQATVTLTAVNCPDEHSPRVLKLTPSTTIVKIGRASKSASKNLHPSPSNAWFDSPVISREHAQLSLVQSPKGVSLTDIGSMHGTKVDGRQLREKEVYKIASDQTVTFGSEIARGSEVFPARQFKINIEWDDWSPPTPLSSSPVTSSPNRAFGIADEDLMVSSEDGTSDGGYPAGEGPQTTVPVTKGSTFIVPDSESSSPCPRANDLEPDEVRAPVERDSDSQVQATNSEDIIFCEAELVDIEFSGPTGLTEQEKAEDEGLFFPTNSAERLPNWYSIAGGSSSSPKQQTKDIAVIDPVRETGDARNPVVINENIDHEGIGKPRPSSCDKGTHPDLGQDAKEDEAYSPPPASAYGSESSEDSDHEIKISVYTSHSDEDDSQEDLDGEPMSEDEFDNEGWPRPVSDRDESAVDYYDELSEAEDDDDMGEVSLQAGPELLKLPVTAEAIKYPEGNSVEGFANILKKKIAVSPCRTAPAPIIGDSQICPGNISGPPARALSHPNTQHQGTTCSLPPIQKMKGSQDISPIYFGHGMYKARAPSPSDAAMVKTPSIQPNLNAHPTSKLRFDEPLPQNLSISTDVLGAINNASCSSSENRGEVTAASSRAGRINTPDSLRAANARKLGERSGKSEFFQAREANRKEVYSNEPDKSTTPPPNMLPTASELVLFPLQPLRNYEAESQDTSSQRHSGVFMDFASTASEAGSFTAAAELFSLPYTTDGASEGEFRDRGYSNATSAAGLRKDCENWMKEKDVDDFNTEAETSKPPGAIQIPREDQGPVASSRVSIRNIVDPVEEVSPVKAGATKPHILPYAGVKRKAAEISSIDSIAAHSQESSQEQPQPGAMDEYSMPDAQPRDQDGFAPPEALISFDSSSQYESPQATHTEEPSSKRVKLTGEPKRSGVAKFAATALAGAVIGGIGVFAALVASAPSV